MTASSWVTVNETFHFYNKSGTYDYMNASSITGGSPGSYQFLYADVNCSVVQVFSVHFETRERVFGAMARRLEETNKALCHQWVKNGTTVTAGCDKFFETECDNSTIYHDYNDTCTSLRLLEVPLKH
ncbi:hypothetical protein V5799_022955 [Amblyomma americanum]|uniref:Lipocalin n=1 Tax=Amblyomma americanum TaxID=6943 RepID=A0AAQ4FJ47_AMBAM